MRQGEHAAVVHRQPGTTQVYDVVLLAGSPRRLTLRLSPDITAETAIEVEGVAWTVADVRSVDQGPTQLICIHAQ